MVRRLLSLTLVFVVIGAPLATAVCQGVCASRDAGTASASSGAASRHSCHEQAAPAHQQALSAAPHVCGHDEELPVALDQALQALAAPAIVPVVAVAAPVIGVAHPIADRTQHRPPDVSALISQLRI